MMLLTGCVESRELTARVIRYKAEEEWVLQKVGTMTIGADEIALPCNVSGLPVGYKIEYNYNTDSLGSGRVGSALLSKGDENKVVVYVERGEEQVVIGYWETGEGSPLKEVSGEVRVNVVEGTNKGVIMYGDGSEWLIITDVRIIKG